MAYDSFQRHWRRPQTTKFMFFSLHCAILLGVFLSSIRTAHATDACTRLPRIEVQFLCDRPLIEEHFNATQIFREYFDTKILPNRMNHTQFQYDLQLYVSVSINTARDVSPREWYSQRCNMHSNETLVTMDVRGYQHWDEPKDFHANDNSSNKSNASESGGSNGTNNNSPIDSHWWKDYPSFGNIQSYLSSQVCGGNEFDYFRAVVYKWDETNYPIPSFGQPDECGTRQEEEVELTQVRGGGQVVYPSSSILRYDGLKSNSSLPKDAYTRRYELKVMEGGYNYDHDLYYVCEGHHLAAEMNDEMPSPVFWMFGVMVGYYMVFMIKAEYARPLRYEQLPRNRNNNNESTSESSSSDDSSSRNARHDRGDEDEDDERVATNRQEIELMTLNPVV